VIAGIAMIAAGFGILWAAGGAGSVNADLARWRARQTRSSRWRRFLEFQARISPSATVWYGRLIAALAFVGGIILIARG
jgi:hypothetical protein